MIYLCIDLKSFYASVECSERGLDPFKVNLVVADPSRHGAITLAISPAMKQLGIKNRCRIYEIPKDIEYICAKPRMKLYMEYSAKIYKIMLKYIASEDIHVYSCDEAFLDVTSYQKLYNKNAKEIAKMITKDIYDSLHITASVGIGTNLYLSKIALDILAKHTKDNMAFLDESLYKQVLWKHLPLTDFWMIGKGSEERLRKLGLYNMYDIAHSDINQLRKMFGINGDIIYDHSWGREQTTISDIKKHQPKSNSLSNSQILFEDYNVNDAYLVLKEMVEGMCLSLTDKGLVTNHISLSIRYTKDLIKASHSSHLINNYTNIYSILIYEFTALYRKIVKYEAPIRQLAIAVGNLKDEYFEEYDLFCDLEMINKEKNSQKAINQIKNKYGKNAILRGMSMMDKATARQRNKMIGGHRSGE